MKVKKLVIKNIGLIADTAIDLNKPLILFYGELMQGKTTLLNSVKWVFGGSYPSDIIRHGQAEASVTLEFDNGSITREWYRSKDGLKTNDRPIVFVLDGKPVKRPVDEIKKFLNPYLLDNEYLKRMGETDRKAYFTQLFSVDTSEIDREQALIEAEGRDLRATIKAYGEIDTTEVKLLDTEESKSLLNSIQNAHKNAVLGWELKKDGIRKNYEQRVKVVNHENTQAALRAGEIKGANERIATAQVEIARQTTIIKDTELWMKLNPPLETLPALPQPEFPEKPEAPDTSALETTIQQGEANKVLYEAYQERLVRVAKKQADEKRLADIETKWRENKKKKIAKLKEIDTGGIKALSFDENGNFTYEGVQAGMLSTSQIMRLSGELSSLYPQGFGLELIDRAESLGKSIFGFIERAQREEKSILATIVGEKPAEVPEHVGVFVVEKGEIK